MKSIFGLEFKVFAVLAGFVVVAATTLGFMTYALDEGRTNQQIASRLSQLDTLSNSLFRRSERYQQVAPRDFPDYNRDVIVFYPDFVADLKGMDTLIKDIGHNYYSRRPAQLIGVLGIGLRTEQLDTSVQTMMSAWQTFYSELKEQLGVNNAEPRLEWGTTYIRENQKQLRTVVNTLITQLNNDLTQQTNRMEDTSYLAMGLLGLMAIAGLIWFYFGVTRRIKRVVAGCVRVSTGDFGYQMQTDNRDEISTLAQAINNMSMRARLVLSLMDKIRGAKDQKTALQAIWDESNPLLDLKWLGLYKLDDNPENMTLLDALPRVWATSLKKQDIRTQNIPRQAIQTKEPVVVNDMEQFTNTNPTERLIRSLSLKVVNCRSTLLLPLVANGQTWGMLTFISSNNDAFSQEHVKLLANLTPLLTEAFTKVEPVEQDPQQDSQAIPNRHPGPARLSTV